MRPIPQSRPLQRLLVAIAALLAPHAASAVTVDLAPTHDATLYEDATGSLANGAGSFLFVGNTGQAGNVDGRRALLFFDVAAAVPAGSTITAVTLTLHVSKTPDATMRAIEVHEATQSWGEGASNDGANEGDGAASLPGDATWIHRFFATQTWTTAGGDFAAAASATTPVGASGTFPSFSSDPLRADVQGWLDNPSTNLGWLLRGDESITRTAKRFDSRENPSGDFRPKLSITYTTPGPGPCIAGDTTLCIDDTPGDHRFKVQIHYASDRDGGISGDAHAVPLASLGFARGGVFWFFAADNPEMLIKVLPGCAITNHYWVYASAGTDVGITLTVTDTVTGHQFVRVYPDHQAVPVIQDVEALPCQ